MAPSAPSAPSGRGRRPLVRRPRLRDFPLVRGERKSRFSPDLTKRAKPEGGDLRSSRASEGADPPSEGPRASAEGAAPRPEGAEGAEGATDPPQHSRSKVPSLNIEAELHGGWPITFRFFAPQAPSLSAAPTRMLAAKTQGVASQSDMWYCTPRPAKKLRARRRSGRANRRLRRAPRVSTAARARSAGGPHTCRTEPAVRSRPICPWRRGQPFGGARNP